MREFKSRYRLDQNTLADVMRSTDVYNRRPQHRALNATRVIAGRHESCRFRQTVGIPSLEVPSARRPALECVRLKPVVRKIRTFIAAGERFYA